MTLKWQQTRALVGVGIMMLSAVGCGGSSESTVQGVVTLDGNPLSDGSIAFIPSAGGSQAYGTIRGSGEYKIYTGRELGLPPGEYKVTVVSRKPAATQRTEEGGPAPGGESITPRWYALPDMSGLLVKVEPGSNNINLELTSQPPAGWKEPAR